MAGQNLQPDPLVEKLIPDLAEQYPGTRVISGFLGRSQQTGYWRLYLSPALDVYLEISEGDIVHNHSLASEGNPLGGTILWIKPEADPELHMRTKLSQRQAKLLTGEASTQDMPQAGLQAVTPDDAATLATFGAKNIGINPTTAGIPSAYITPLCGGGSLFCNRTWSCRP